jgi:N-acetylglucosamine-6-sulfatase
VEARSRRRGRFRLAVGVLSVLAVLGAASAPGAGASTGGGTGGKPNILVVMTDDMAASDLKFMPNVQRLLVDKGTTFTNAVDSFPLCCPARATFITGQYAHNHGVFGNFYPYGWYGMQDRGNILPAWLQSDGYRTALIGKWLNGYGALDAHGEVPTGFDTWRGLLDVSAYDYYNFVMNADGQLRTWGDADFARKLVEFANVEVTPNPAGLAGVLAKLTQEFGPPPYHYWGSENPGDYSPDVTAKVTDDLIAGERSDKKPFFIWWAPAAPHREDVSVTLMGRPGDDPRPPARYADAVKRYQLPRPPSFNEADISDKSSNLKNAAPPMTDAQIHQLELDYQGRIGSLMAVDDHVGQIVDTLKRTGQLGNTLIMFLSDNGWLQGEHRVTGDKFLPFEESVKVPLVLRGPGIPAGKMISSQVADIDFAPTLVDLSGASPGRTMDGVSLLPGIHNPKKLPDRAIELEAPAPLFEGNIPVNAWDRPYTGVRTDRYTYVVWTETGEQELYDRQADPYQLRNVASDPAYAAIKASLAADLVRLNGCAGSDCNVSP